MGSPHDRLVLAASGVTDNPSALARYMRKKGLTMSPELRAELEAKHAARVAAKKGGKRKRAVKKVKRRIKKAKKVGIRHMKELQAVMTLKKVKRLVGCKS